MLSGDPTRSSGVAPAGAAGLTVPVGLAARIGLAARVGLAAPAGLPAPDGLAPDGLAASAGLAPDGLAAPADLAAADGLAGTGGLAGGDRFSSMPPACDCPLTRNAQRKFCLGITRLMTARLSTASEKCLVQWTAGN